MAVKKKASVKSQLNNMKMGETLYFHAPSLNQIKRASKLSKTKLTQFNKILETINIEIDVGSLPKKYIKGKQQFSSSGKVKLQRGRVVSSVNRGSSSSGKVKMGKK